MRYLSGYKIFESESESEKLLESDFVLEIQDILIDIVDTGKFRITKSVWIDNWESINDFNLSKEYSYESILFTINNIENLDDSILMLIDCLKRVIGYIERFDNIGYTLYLGKREKLNLDNIDKIVAVYTDVKRLFIELAIFTE